MAKSTQPLLNIVWCRPDFNGGRLILELAIQETSHLLFCMRDLATIDNKMKKKRKNSRRDFIVGSWNVRTLVECSGDVRVCRKRQVLGERSEVVDRKLDLLVSELKRYRVSVAGIQESRWFGKDVWPAADGYTFLHSGRPLPEDGDVAARNEGVGILLDENAAAAWRQCGEVRKAVSSRIVMARLKWIGKGQRRSGECRENKNVFVSVICVYAPTARATPAVKAKFSNELQDTLDKVPQSDVLVMLGDFNARVGVLKPDDEDEWRGVVGGEWYR